MKQFNWLITEDAQKCKEEASELAHKLHVLREALSQQFPGDETEYALRNTLNAALGISKSYDIPETATALANDLADSFKGLHPTKETIRLLYSESANPGHVQVMYDLAAERDIRNRFENLPLKSFDQELEKEYLKRRWQLRHWKKGMEAAGYPNTDPEDLFLNSGRGNEIVLKSNPVIAPYFANSGISGGRHDERGTPWLLENSANNSKLAGLVGDTGYNLGVGFAERHTGPKDDPQKQQRLFTPLVCLDREVLSALTGMIRGENKGSRRVAADLLTGLRKFYSLSIHDYVHQSIFIDLLKVFDRGNRFSDKSPILKDGLPFDLHKGLWDGSFGKNDSVIPPGEKLAELVLRDTWEHIFQTEKGKPVKQALIRQATAFLTDLETFREREAKRLGEETANRMATYLAIVAMGRFFRLVKMEDKDLSEVQSKGKTFKDAANNLKLPVYTPALEDIQSNIDEDPAVQRNVITVMHPFARAPVRFAPESGNSGTPKWSKPLDAASYAVRRLREWSNQPLADQNSLTEALKDLRLDGMNGLQARVIFQGSRVPGWSNNFSHWESGDLEKLAEYYRRITAEEFLEKRPSYQAIVQSSKSPSDNTPTTHLR